MVSRGGVTYRGVFIRFEIPKTALVATCSQLLCFERPRCFLSMTTMMLWLDKREFYTVKIGTFFFPPVEQSWVRPLSSSTKGPQICWTEEFCVCRNLQDSSLTISTDHEELGCYLWGINNIFYWRENIF